MMLWGQEAPKQYKKQELELNNISYIHQNAVPFRRPLTACTANCVHHRGGGWKGNDFFVRCNLDKDPDPDNPIGITKPAPEVGACANYVEGSMRKRGSA